MKKIYTLNAYSDNKNDFTYFFINGISSKTGYAKHLEKTKILKQIYMRQFYFFLRKMERGSFNRGCF